MIVSIDPAQTRARCFADLPCCQMFNSEWWDYCGGKVKEVQHMR